MRDLEIRYAVSLVSLMCTGWQRGVRFPGCLFAPPDKLIETALGLGYDGVQALPIRGFTGLNANGVLLFEDAWNAVPSLWHALRHYTGASGLPSCINDWVVSPTPSECREVVKNLEFRGIQQVVHHFDSHANHLVEVNPGLDMTPEQIVAECQRTGQRLVLDTEHITGGYRDYEIAVRPDRSDRPSPLGHHRRATSILSRWVDAIHLKPISGSVEEFVRPDFNHAREEKYLCDLVLAHAPGPVTVVAEYAPTRGMLLSPTKSRDLAARMLEAMHRLVET